jgi:hypothetical protein
MNAKKLTIHGAAASLIRHTLNNLVTCTTDLKSR